MTVRTSSVATVIKRLTGANLEATREFLLRDCFVPGKGFSSQYAGQGTVSCTTSAICIYALSETGHLTQRQKRGFTRVLLAFRAAMPWKRPEPFRGRLEESSAHGRRVKLRSRC